jgi:large subunit ribosomal protein L22
MAKHHYAYQKSEENTVKAVGRNIGISPKQSIEICKYVRGRTLAQAKMMLRQAIDMKRAVPFTRFSNGLGHKPGMSAGRYNPKACSEIMKVIESAEANAKNKGYNTADLKLVHIAMQIGPLNRHQGRQRRSIFKNSHIEVVLQEVKGLSAKKKGVERKNVDKKNPETGNVEKKDVKTSHKTAKSE